MSGINQPCPIPQIYLEEPDSENDFECDEDVTMATTCMSADSLDVMHAMARQHIEEEDEKAEPQEKGEDETLSEVANDVA